MGPLASWESADRRPRGISEPDRGGEAHRIPQRRRPADDCLAIQVNDCARMAPATSYGGGAGVKIGLPHREGDVGPFVHLHARNELVRAVLRAEDRGLAFLHVEPILSEPIDDVWLVRDENGVGAGLR
jgi:hypothetical protein